MTVLLASPMSANIQTQNSVRRTNEKTARERKHAYSYNIRPRKDMSERLSKISDMSGVEAIKAAHGNIDDHQASLRDSNPIPRARSPLNLLFLQ